MAPCSRRTARRATGAPPRRSNHSTVGGTQEVCDQLAHHWARSDRAIAALPYLLAAAEGAVTVGPNPEAITHLQGALDLATAHSGAVSQPQRDMIRLKLAGLHFVVGER
jgi:hypothetical protein